MGKRFFWCKLDWAYFAELQQPVKLCPLHYMMCRVLPLSAADQLPLPNTTHHLFLHAHLRLALRRDISVVLAPDDLGLEYSVCSQ